MRLAIRSQDGEATPEWQSGIERRLRFVLARFRSRIRWVTVYLAADGAVDGRDAGMAKKCRVVVSLLGHGQVQVEVTDSSLDAAVTRALRRIGQFVHREVERRGRRRFASGPGPRQARRERSTLRVEPGNPKRKAGTSLDDSA